MRQREVSSKSVSFRLPVVIHEVLEERSLALGRSVGDCAREAVVATLQDERRLEVERLLGELTEEVARLRQDVAKVLETVLLNVTELPEETVRCWVREHLSGA